MAAIPAFCQWEFLSPPRFTSKKTRSLFCNLQQISEPESEAAIELEFFGPDGSGEAFKTSVKSGDKLLRNVMIENKLELYGLYGKVMNCGGGGSCGTCIVEVLQGQEFLNQQTDAEKKHLKKKPGNWRLACQTIVGDKSNSGKVVVQRLPQKKK